MGYHLPKYHIRCQNPYGIETIIKLILVPLRVDPLLSVVCGWVNHEVASIWLKIAEQVAYGKVLIATRGFCPRQNSYGFRAI